MIILDARASEPIGNVRSVAVVRVRSRVSMPSPEGDSGNFESIPGTAVPGYRLLRPFGTEVRVWRRADNGGVRDLWGRLSGDVHPALDVDQEEVRNSSVT